MRISDGEPVKLTRTAGTLIRAFKLTDRDGTIAAEVREVERDALSGTLDQLLNGPIPRVKHLYLWVQHGPRDWKIMLAGEAAERYLK